VTSTGNAPQGDWRETTEPLVVAPSTHPKGTDEPRKNQNIFFLRTEFFKSEPSVLQRNRIWFGNDNVRVAWKLVPTARGFGGWAAGSKSQMEPSFPKPDEILQTTGEPSQPSPLTHSDATPPGLVLSSHVSQLLRVDRSLQKSLGPVPVATSI
jgi:hypothetical protein